jgi:hypothetical protein
MISQRRERRGDEASEGGQPVCPYPISIISYRHHIGTSEGDLDS